MDSEDQDKAAPSRRSVVAGATGLAAALAAPAILAQNASQGREAGKENPVPEYPRPPFKKQSQQRPGLAGKMEPVPDHGEKSYKGSGRLTGRKALITGGDSGIGRAAAIAFAREGADVAINYLPVEEPDAREVVQLIQAAGRKGVTIPGDIRSEDFCRQLVSQAVDRLGGLDILVNNAGMQQARESIADLTSEQFRFNLQDERLRDVLDYQGRHAASASGRGHYQYGLGGSLRPFASAARLRSDQSVHRCIHQISGQAGCEAGYSSECCRPRPHLDPSTAERRPTAGQAG